MMKKVVLNVADNKATITGELIGLVVPVGVVFNSLTLETKDFTIFKANDLSNGYYPIAVQARSVDGAWVSNHFEHFKLDDEVTLNASVNVDQPSDVILLFDSKFLVEV